MISSMSNLTLITAPARTTKNIRSFWLVANKSIDAFLNKIPERQRAAPSKQQSSNYHLSVKELLAATLRASTELAATVTQTPL
jgi:hypothetical protein